MSLPGQKTVLSSRARHVRSALVSGHPPQAWTLFSCQKRTQQWTKGQSYSITSSARASSVGGTVRPSALAVLRLITSSYFVGACTGRSAGFSPRTTPGSANRVHGRAPVNVITIREADIEIGLMKTLYHCRHSRSGRPTSSIRPKVIFRKGQVTLIEGFDLSTVSQLYCVNQPSKRICGRLAQALKWKLDSSLILTYFAVVSGKTHC
jgi:hypothetical protein